MKQQPAIAVMELNSIPRGIFTGDAMVKNSPVSILRSGTVHNGKYLILVGGSVASVEEAYRTGLTAGEGFVTDSLFLPDPHMSVVNALSGKRETCSGQSIATIETLTVPAAVKAADAGIKGAEVRILEIRMADDLGGKGLIIFTGKLEEVETAVKISVDVLSEKETLLDTSIIPRPEEETGGQLNRSSSFRESDPRSLEGGEV